MTVRLPWPWIAAAAGAITAVLSVLGAPTGLPPMDAGDFATASVTLGIPHSPGFPVQTMLGHAATTLPLGSLAWRISLLSALATGAVVAGLVALAACWARSSWTLATVAVAGVLAATRLAPLALAARMPEVYALAQFSVLATALLCLHWSWARSDRPWLLAAVAGVLGVLQHPMVAVPMVALALLALRRRPSGVGLASTPLLAGLAAAALTYLPVAALSAPAHAWAQADTWSGFIALVTGANIRTAFAAEQAGTWTESLEYLRQWAVQFEQVSLLSPLMLALLTFIGAGLLFALQRDRRLLLGLLVVTILALADLWWAIRVNPMGMRDAQVGGLACLLLLAGPAMFWVELAVRVPGRWAPAATSTALAALLVLTTNSSPMLDSFDSGAPFEDAIAAVHGTAAPGFAATWLSDDMTAAATFRQIALDERPDASSFGRWLFDAPPALDLYLATRREPAWRAAIEQAEREPGQSVMLDFLTANLGRRALYWEVAGSTTDLPPLVQLSWTQAWPAARPGLAFNEVRPAWRYDAAPDPVFAGRSRQPASWFYRRWLASQWAVQGVRLTQQGEFARAVPFFERSTELAPDSSAWSNNLAFALASSGQVEQAFDVALATWRRDRLSQPAWRNVQLYANHLRRPIPDEIIEWGAAVGWESPLR